MITSYKSILDFLRIDFPLVFKNSLLLGIVYLFLIPVIRGTSNLDAIHSADVFGQSLVLTGAILLIPITKWELETSVKEIVCTKAWSYIKSVSIRLICGFLLITVMIVTFAFIMQFKNCVFPFWEYVSITILYAVFLGIIGLCFSQFAGNVIVGYLAVLGYWSLCQFRIICEGDMLYMFPFVKGIIDMERVWILLGTDIVLISSFQVMAKWSKKDFFCRK